LLKLARVRRTRLLQENPAAGSALQSRRSNEIALPLCWDRLPTDRFKLTLAADWSYAGREKFTELLDMASSLKGSFQSGCWLYGTIGYGKSHLLAAITCYLTVAGKRVVYIPDCRSCACFQSAMLLTWVDDDNMWQRILRLESMEDVVRFLQYSASDSLLIVGQLNALAGFFLE
jgi:hypothetical protein